MKIVVGKTYKDSYGREFYIECRLVGGGWRGWFLGTTSSLHSPAYFKEDGTSDVCMDAFALLPNRVKKTAWGWKRSGPGDRVYLCPDEATSDSIVGSNGAWDKVKSIWYEDEE